jgi:putative tricarboxylic transport membrane protein
MRFNDTVSGVLAAVLGGAVLVAARGFPETPGEPGPGLFPAIAGSGLVVFGLVLVIAGFRSRRPWLEVPEWTTSPRSLLGALIVVVGLAGCAALFERAGFLVCAPALLTALMVTLRVRPRVAVATAVVATLFAHAVFYSGLRVPLPWGLLEPLAW